jgi:hypothetical protein
MKAITSWIKDLSRSGLAILMLGIIMAGYFLGTPLVSFIKEKTSSSVSSTIDMAYSKMEGPILGAEVVAAAEEFKTNPQFSFLIKTKSTPAGFYTENNYPATGGTGIIAYAVPTTGNLLSVTPGRSTTPVTINAIKDTSNAANYVNPSVTFDGKIYRTPDGVVRLVEVIQR